MKFTMWIDAKVDPDFLPIFYDIKVWIDCKTGTWFFLLTFCANERNTKSSWTDIKTKNKNKNPKKQ